jgi:hypothetical protein
MMTKVRLVITKSLPELMVQVGYEQSIQELLPSLNVLVDDPGIRAMNRTDEVLFVLSFSIHITGGGDMIIGIIDGISFSIDPHVRITLAEKLPSILKFLIEVIK